MDLSGTENNEADTTGFILAQHNHPEFLELQNSENSQEGHSLLNAYFGQEGSPMEAVQVGGSMQTCTLLNGVYKGPGVKDVTGSISVSSSVCLRGPSELQDTEGAAKDLSAFLGSSYSTVFSDSLGSIVHDIKSPQQLTTATWHRQTPVQFQNFQNYLFKDMDTPKELLLPGTLRVVRPLSEGRGKSHMLPRYWPRMTEKELQLLSTQDANSKVIPLFEKILSASDAGKVGRLVLPKACAEAYFPPISQPEGVPLIVQDITGKEWVFQFRFWPNNNSRMYVLEGITPCIQAMNLQAGDTVIFSRLDPQGKLVMGCRRAPNISSAEDNQKPMTANSMAPAYMRVVSTGVTEKVSMVPSLTRLLMQTEESSVRVQGNKKLGPFNVRVADNGYKLYSIEKLGSMCQDESFYEHVVCEKRKAKDVVTKAKRQQVEAEKIEFRKNWEAAQNLLQSPPNVTPTIVTIEGYDFEEYEIMPMGQCHQVAVTLYGNIGVQPGFQCAAGSYGMPGANMGMAGFAQPEAQNLNMACRPAFAGGNLKAPFILKTNALQWWTTLLNQGVVPSTWVQFKQIFAPAWITNMFEVDVMTAWNQLSAVNCESLEEYNAKFWDALLPGSSFTMVPLAEQIEKYRCEVADDLIQGKLGEDGFKTCRKEPQGKQFSAKGNVTSRLTVPPFKKKPFAGNLLFQDRQGFKRHFTGKSIEERKALGDAKKCDICEGYFATNAHKGNSQDKDDKSDRKGKKPKPSARLVPDLEPPVFGKDILSTTCSARSFCLKQDVEKDRDSSFLQHAQALRKAVKNDTSMDKVSKKDAKQEGISWPLKVAQPYSGLETLASVATTEENTSDSAVTSAAVTTKHPRHRPGCSCIVCIQPPSGQGPKHKPNCDCNVCLTVKRRFQTLMLRRKKLQSERAAENAAQRNNQLLVIDSNFTGRRALESGFYQAGSWQGCMPNPYSNAPSQIAEGLCSGNTVPSGFSFMRSFPVKDANSNYEQIIPSKGTQFDLNSQPDREEEMNRGGLPTSMKGLLQSAGYSLDLYLREQGLTSLVCHDQELESLESPVDAIIPKEEECDYSLSAGVYSNSEAPKAEPSFDQAG
ncbi:hypothetical protein L7F22_046403 [Adiantum nelumboides]|nr:hypothetical protein [Adiantum nelumboides]